MIAISGAMQRTDAHEGPAAAVREEERGTVPVVRAVARHIHAHADAIELEVLALQHAGVSD